MEIEGFRTTLKVRLGQGSFGAVFLGENTKDGTLVAFKLSAVPKITPDMEEVEKLRAQCIKRGLETERFILSRFNHPHLLRKFDSIPTVTSHGVEYALFVLEYCDKGTLWDFALSGEMPLTEANIKAIISQILSGLVKLHEGGLIHRDLNLRNVLVSGSICKIADFGCSKNLQDGDAITQIRTQNFAAPEIGKGVYDYKADIYSVAIILETLIKMSIGQHESEKIILLNDLQKQSGFSKDCFNLLMRMRLSNPKTRIDWPEILNHPWLAGQFVMINSLVLTIHTPLPPPSPPSSSSLDSVPSPTPANHPSDHAVQEAESVDHSSTKPPEESLISDKEVAATPSSLSSPSSSILSWMWPFSWFSTASAPVHIPSAPTEGPSCDAEVTQTLTVETDSNAEKKKTETDSSSSSSSSSLPQEPEPQQQQEDGKKEKRERTTSYLEITIKDQPSTSDILSISKTVFSELKSLHRISSSLRSSHPTDSFILLKFIAREISASLTLLQSWNADPVVLQRLDELKKRSLFEALELSESSSSVESRSVVSIVVDHCDRLLKNETQTKEEIKTATAVLIYLTKSSNPDPRIVPPLHRLISLWNDLCL